MPPKVSIVIRTFNEEAHVGQLLNAIGRQNLRDLEVIIVDSGSTDQTLLIVGRYPVKVMKIQPKDFTFGRSLNIGVRAASREFIVFASAHVLPMSDEWLANLIAPFADDRVALVYGKQRGGEGGRFSESEHFKRWFPETSVTHQENSYCNNANAAVRRSLWLQHPFDEELTGLEDLAWGSWAREAGYAIAYVAEAGVLHYHHETPAQIVNRHRREAIALKRILPGSRFTLRHFASEFSRAVSADIKSAWQQGILARELMGIIAFRFLQYRGTYLGYRDPSLPSRELAQTFYYPPGSLEPQRGASNKPNSAKEALPQSK
ncbi:MAG: glycosyltransferase family 2 protein [Anaerolineales bacterium]